MRRLIIIILLLENIAYAQTHTIQFTNVSLQAMVHQGHISVGVAWGDIDNDNNLDIYITNHYSECDTLYKNNGNGTFTNITATANINDAIPGTGVAFGDYDNDGDLDIYVTNSAFWAAYHDILYQNNGNNTFTNITQQANLFNISYSNSVAWADYDNDGDLDIYIANHGEPNYLYRNNGNGSFTNIASTAGVDHTGNDNGVAFGDYDNDGDLDIYIANSGPNVLYRNDGNGKFSDVTSYAKVGNSGNSSSAVFSDYNNDGYLDIYVVNYDSTNVLYQNNGDGTFEDVTLIANVGYAGGWQEAVTSGDFDNDGYLDIYVTDYMGTNVLYHNNGDGTFDDISQLAGVGNGNSGDIGVACADYDNDGDLDIYICVAYGNNILYRNEGNSNNWLKVKPIGYYHKDAIGTRVKIITGDMIQIREVSGGSGYCSQDSLEVEFGLGTHTIIDRLEIRWQEGGTYTLTNILPNQTIFATQTPIQKIYISPTIGTIGTIVTIKGKGFGVNEPIRISFGTTKTIALTNTLLNGIFSTTFTIDAQLTGGTKTITVYGLNSKFEKNTFIKFLYGTPTALVLITSTHTVHPWMPSGTITIQIRDIYNNPITVTSDTIITLTSNNDKSRFAIAPVGVRWRPTGNFIIKKGDNSLNLFYKYNGYSIIPEIIIIATCEDLKGTLSLATTYLSPDIRGNFVGDDGKTIVTTDIGTFVDDGFIEVKIQPVHTFEINSANQIDDLNYYYNRIDDTLRQIIVHKTTITTTATITIPYLDINQDGEVDNTYPTIDELTLRIYQLQDMRWMYVGGVVDPVANNVSAKISNSSFFILIGKPKLLLPEVTVYPIPFMPKDKEIIFENLPKNATIRIYTISGELVRKIENLNQYHVSWDTRNNAGNEVASGVYIYIITNSEGKKYTGKLVIIR